MTTLIDLTGQQFGSLTVISRARNTFDACGTLRTQWKCKCKCGKTTIVKSRYLRRGSTKNCGQCYKKEWYENYE